MPRSGFSSLVDDVVPEKKPPRAVVLLIGWWGSKTSHLEKYAEIYKQRNCLTICCIPNTVAVLFHYTPSFDALALEAAARVAKILRSIGDGNTPVIIHIFSNGGAFTLDRLHLQIEKARAAAENGNPDVLLVGERLEGEFFDSGPCHVDADISYRALSLVFQNQLLLGMAWIWFVINDALVWCMNRLFGIQSGADIFWDDMLLSRVCLKQAYAYSREDMVTNVPRLEELIEIRCKMSDDVLVECFQGSSHVMHYREHPEQYLRLVDMFLEK